MKYRKAKKAFKKVYRNTNTTNKGAGKFFKSLYKKGGYRKWR